MEQRKRNPRPHLRTDRAEALSDRGREKTSARGKMTQPLKYKVDIQWDERDGVYVARVPELSGCATDGKTIEEAAANARQAIEAYLASLDARGKPLPRPLSEKPFSGKIPLRIDPVLHRDLAYEAEQQGVSLNRFIEKKLRKAV
jgi:antitoxin HicB